MRVGQELSGHLLTTSGVRQGCVLAPSLFCIAIDWILWNVTSRPGITVGQQHFTDLVYADNNNFLLDNSPTRQLPLVRSRTSQLGDRELHTQNIPSNIRRVGYLASWPTTSWFVRELSNKRVRPHVEAANTTATAILFHGDDTKTHHEFATTLMLIDVYFAEQDAKNGEILFSGERERKKGLLSIKMIKSMLLMCFSISFRHSPCIHASLNVRLFLLYMSKPHATFTLENHPQDWR